MLMTLGLFAASSLPQAAAQAIGEGSPLDASAQEPEEESPGVRAGAFQLRPSATFAVAYDSNVFAAPADSEAKVFTVAEAQLQLASEPGVNAVMGRVFARARRFDAMRNQDTTEYGASAAFERQRDGQDAISGNLVAQRLFESRVEIETPNFREVSFYREWRGEAQYSHVFNRLAVSSRISGRTLEYENSSQAFRDRSYYRGEVRGDYDLRNGLSFSASGYYSGDDYHSPDSFVAGGNTAGALVGGRWNSPEIVDFEFAGGYFHRTYSRQRGGISGIAVRGSTTVRMTPLLTVRAEVVREDAPTRIAGAFGKVRTSGRLEVRHEYSRTIDFRIRGRFVLDEFDNIPRTDKTVTIQTGITWSVFRNLLIAVEYDYATRMSDFSQEEFARHVVGFSLMGRF